MGTIQMSKLKILGANGLLLIVVSTLLSLSGGTSQSGAQTSPIDHVIVIYQENHSFDNVFGRWCHLRPARHCNGAVVGKTSDGALVHLSRTPDIVPDEGHTGKDQVKAIHGGRMDRFDLIRGCSDLSCYSAYSPKTDAPTLAQLARSFVISDRTFSSVPEPSFGAHLELVAATNDGFLPKNPVRFGPPPGGPGWGCDSGKIIQWRDAVTGYVAWEPACIPFADGSGTFLSYSPVPHVPTIMDRLDVAGRTWKIYAATPDQDSPLAIPYGWAICPSFADCIETSQRNNMAQSSQVVTDAQTGALPNFSVVLPNNKNSQHNGFSMLQGDNWIGQVVSAIMHGPDWGSTAIFITYDDCGCFYDHVAPPPGAGIRMPMVIVSPYARPAFTDHGTATFASMLAYTEHVFDLPSLGAADQYAYDYSNSFDYAQTPLPPIHLSQHEVSRASRIYVRTHPLRPDET